VTPEVRGWFCEVILVLRTFLELVRRSIQNLVEICQADTGQYKQSVSYIYRLLANRSQALPGKNLMHFLYSKVFSPVICYGFGA